MWRSRRPVEHGGSPASEYAQAAWHRPKPLIRVISLRCKVVAVWASDRGVLRRLDVRAWAGYGVADVAGARRNVARGFAQFKNYSA
jgi:hypothetical protein